MAGRNLFAPQGEQNQRGARNLLATPDEAKPVESPSAPNPAPLQQTPAQMVESGFDVAKVLASGAAAEPVAGLAGLLTQNIFNPFPTPDERAAVVSNVRDFLTAEPSTEGGRQTLATMANFMQPVAETLTDTREAIGGNVLEATGSPVLASVASTAPDAGIELLGLLTGGALSKGTRGAARVPMKQQIIKGLKKSAPGESVLKGSADKLFKSVDDMGVTVKPQPFQNVVDNLEAQMLRSGADPDVTSSAWGTLQRLKRDAGKPLTLGEIETVREVAKGTAAITNNPREAMLGTMAVEAIDNFLETLEPSQLITGKANARMVGETYKKARDQWGRYRRAEALTDAVEIASTRASGWENGVRNEFRNLHRRIVSGKEKGFKPHEVAAIKKVADGTAPANIFRILGTSGLAGGNLGQNWLGAFLTGSGAYSLGGAPAALAAVGAGTGFKKLAQRMTRGNADFANAVIRAGNSGQDIVEAYMRFTPKASRSVDELSTLLIHQDVDLAPLQRFRFERQAADLAAKRRAELAGLLAAGETRGETIDR